MPADRRLFVLGRDGATCPIITQRVFNIAPSLSYVRRTEIFSTIVDGELIIMDGGGEVFYGSNAVACVIWAALERPMSADALSDTVLRSFQGADAATVGADVAELLKQLQERDLIDVAHGA